MIGHDHTVAQEPRVPTLQGRDKDSAVLVQQRDGHTRIVLSNSIIRRTTEVRTVVAITSRGALVVDVNMIVIARYNDTVVVMVTVGGPLVVDVDVVVIA